MPRKERSLELAASFGQINGQGNRTGGLNTQGVSNPMTAKNRTLKDKNPLFNRSMVEEAAKGGAGGGNGSGQPSTTINNNNIVININKTYSVSLSTCNCPVEQVQAQASQRGDPGRA